MESNVINFEGDYDRYIFLVKKIKNVFSVEIYLRKVIRTKTLSINIIQGDPTNLIKAKNYLIAFLRPQNSLCQIFDFESKHGSIIMKNIETIEGNTGSYINGETGSLFVYGINQEIVTLAISFFDELIYNLDHPHALSDDSLFDSPSKNATSNNDKAEHNQLDLKDVYLTDTSIDIRESSCYIAFEENFDVNMSPSEFSKDSESKETFEEIMEVEYADEISSNPFNTSHDSNNSHEVIDIVSSENEGQEMKIQCKKKRKKRKKKGEWMQIDQNIIPMESTDPVEKSLNSKSTQNNTGSSQMIKNSTACSTQSTFSGTSVKDPQYYNYFHGPPKFFNENSDKAQISTNASVLNGHTNPQTSINKINKLLTKVNKPDKQSTNQNKMEPDNKPTNTNKPNIQPTNHNKPANQPANQNKQNIQPTNHNKPANQNKPNNQPANHNKPNNQPANQIIHKPNNQPTNQQCQSNQPIHQFNLMPHTYIPPTNKINNNGFLLPYPNSSNQVLSINNIANNNRNNLLPIPIIPHPKLKNAMFPIDNNYINRNNNCFHNNGINTPFPIPSLNHLCAEPVPSTSQQLAAPFFNNTSISQNINYNFMHNYPNNLHCSNTTKPNPNTTAIHNDASRRTHNDASTSTHNDASSSNLRIIVVDGSNVAMQHGLNKTFSCKGIKLVVDYFVQRGHKVTVFVPQWRRSAHNYRGPFSDLSILELLFSNGQLSFTPSRKVGNQIISSYDDRFILRLATDENGVVISNDQYQDLYEEDCFKETIHKRILQVTFIGDKVMFPDDPLGRQGPCLDIFLTKNWAKYVPKVSKYRQRTSRSRSSHFKNHKKK